MKHCDEPVFWMVLLTAAVEFGVAHANADKPVLTEAKLLAALRDRECHGQPFGYRRGHANYLRRAYGAAYNGVKLTQSAVRTQ